MEEVEADVLGTLRVAAERTIVQRNVIRRNAKLPQLDVDHELAREVAVLTRRAQREAASIFADDLRRIHHDTLTEYQTTHGPQFGKSVMSHMILTRLVEQRQQDFLKKLKRKNQTGSTNSSPIAGEP